MPKYRVAYKVFHTRLHETGFSSSEQHLPASFVCETVAQRPHVVSNCDPFGPADDANVLHRQDGEEEVLVGAVVPILIHPCGESNQKTDCSQYAADGCG